MILSEDTTKQEGQYLPLSHPNFVGSLLFVIKELVICTWKPRACVTSITLCAKSKSYHRRASISAREKRRTNSQSGICPREVRKSHRRSSISSRDSREVFVGRRLEHYKYESSHRRVSMTTFLFGCNHHLATISNPFHESCLCRPTIGTSRVRSCLRRAWMKGNDFYFSFIKRTLLHSAIHSFAYSMVSWSSSSGASSMYFW